MATKKTEDTSNSQNRSRRQNKTEKADIRSNTETPVSSGTLKSTLRTAGHSPQLVRQRPSDLPSRPLDGELSGDLEGLETEERDGFESVSELADEGQDFEAEQLDGIERAPDPDQGELKPRKVPNGAVPHRFKDRNRL